MGGQQIMDSLRWFEIGISIDLDNLQNYVNTLEQTLVQQKKSFEEMVDRQAAEIEEEYRDEFYEYHSDEHWQLSDVFPSTLRSSVFVASYSMFEHHLVDVCKREYKRQKLAKVPNFRNRVIFSAKEYLENDAKIKLPNKMPAWDMICVYNKLRNTIIHENGKLNERIKEELKGYLSKSSAVTLDQYDILHFTEEFCLEVIKNMKEFFFKELLPAIPD